MNIEINVFDVNSILAAEKELKDYKRKLQDKVNLLCKKLAELGATKVKMVYDIADYPTTHDIKTTVEPRGEGYVIKASGTDVLFVEFGTGFKHTNEWGDQYGLPVGSYSDGVNGKGHWDNPNGWWYPGGGKERTFGNEAARAFQFAQNEMLLHLTRVAKEVFND